MWGYLAEDIQVFAPLICGSTPNDLQTPHRVRGFGQVLLTKNVKFSTEMFEAGSWYRLVVFFESMRPCRPRRVKETSGSYILRTPQQVKNPKFISQPSLCPYPYAHSIVFLGLLFLTIQE